jgi:integration host factor subunit beta
MNKSDLINLLSEKVTHLSSKDMEIIVNTVFDSMTNSLMDGKRIEIRGFGSFEIRVREPRVGRNPKSGNQVKIGTRRVPFFKVGKELRERINSNHSV